MTREQEEDLEDRLIKEVIGEERKYLKRILVMPALSVEEERRYITKIRQGDEKARDFFLKTNQKLVASIAFNFTKKWEGLHLSVLELISEGNVGLIQALEDFKPEKGNKFSTYATPAIKNAMLNFCCQQGKVVQVKRKYYNKVISPVKKIIRHYMQEQGREPTFEELTKESGLNREQVVEAYWYSQAPVVCNLYSKNGQIEFKDSIPKLNPKWTEYLREYEETKKQVVGILERILDPREVIVICKRAGIDEPHPLTLEEVGKIYGVTKERVRQIEGEALTRLYAQREKYEREIRILLADFSKLREKIYG